MAVGSLLSIGAQGVQSGVRRANEAAQDIAAGGAEAGGDLVTPLVALKASEHVAAASAKVIEAADETLGTLIDTLA